MPIFERAGRLGLKNRRSIARPPGRNFALQENALDHGVFGLSALSTRGLRAEKVAQNMLRTTRASSDILLGSQGGSQTTLTSTFPTPGTVETASCTITGSS